MSRSLCPLSIPLMGFYSQVAQIPLYEFLSIPLMGFPMRNMNLSLPVSITFNSPDGILRSVVIRWEQFMVAFNSPDGIPDLLNGIIPLHDTFNSPDGIPGD